MKFSFENLGYIDKGEIVPSSLTIICGDNNTGKTYINYAIYGLLYILSRNPDLLIEEEKINSLIQNKTLKIDLNEIINNIDNITKINSENYTSQLQNIFSSNDNLFKDTKITFEIFKKYFSLAESYHIVYEAVQYNKQLIIFDKDKHSNILNISFVNEENEKISRLIIKDILTKGIFSVLLKEKIKNPFIVTSERTGVSLFWKELDINKNILIEKILKTKNVNIPDLFLTDLSRYPISIKHNIDVIRDVKEILNLESEIKKNNKTEFDELMGIFSSFLSGKFKIQGDEVNLIPKKLKKRANNVALPLHLASSASRSILLLFIYINSLAKKNDILFIDEPELNLHPSKQILMARILANIANLGIDVLVTTHSDYIVKEINNLIMLSNDFSKKDELLKKYNYKNSDILTPNKVKAYYTKKQSIKEAKIDKYGIDMELFDDTIANLNKISNDIYYSIEEE